MNRVLNIIFWLKQGLAHTLTHIPSPALLPPNLPCTPPSHHTHTQGLSLSLSLSFSLSHTHKRAHTHTHTHTVSLLSLTHTHTNMHTHTESLSLKHIHTHTHTHTVTPPVRYTKARLFWVHWARGVVSIWRRTRSTVNGPGPSEISLCQDRSGKTWGYDNLWPPCT